MTVTRYPAPFAINARDHAARGDGSNDDTAEIQAALTAGTGRAVSLPAGSSYYKISAALTVPAGTTVLLDRGTIIEQTTKYLPVFDCSADGATIEGNGALLRYTGSRAYTGGGNFRGADDYTYGAGVWAAADRVAVRNLHITGFTCGIYFSGWDGAAMTANVNAKCSAENILAETVDFGVLFNGQSDLTLRGIRGQSVLASSSPNPSHLIYGSHAARNRNVAVSDCEAWDNADSYAFQFKGCDGGTVKNLAARACAGLLSIGGGSGAHNTDLRLANVQGRDLTTSGGNGAVYFQGSDLRVSLDGVGIHQAASDRAIRLDGTDCVVANAVIRARHDTQADTHDITVQGTRNKLDGFDIINIQDDGSDYTTGWRGVHVTTGTRCVIRPRVILNTRIGVDIASGATSPLIDLSGADIVLASVSGSSRIFNASTTARILGGQPVKTSADNGNAAKTLTVLTDETTQVWNTAITADRAVTLSTTGAYNGARWHIVRTAAATGAFNLNVGTGPLKALVAGTWCDVEYNGSAWVLTGYGAL